MNARRAPPRVLMTADAVGGVWTYALDLSAGLDRAGFEIALAVLGPGPSPEQIREARRIEGLRLVDTGLPLDWLAADRAAVEHASGAVADIAAAHEADVVHLNSPALAADRRFRTPTLGACHSCLATWWAAVKTGPMPPDFVWRTDHLARGLAACGGLIAPSATFAATVGRTYGVRTPTVVLNGRAAAPVTAGQPREPVVLAAGRLWDGGKNLWVLDEGARLAGVALRLAGPLTGPGGDTARFRHGQPLGRLAGPTLAAEMARVQVFASAALYEPFGLSALEAANVGCALVLSDIPTHRELWGGAALFADPRQPAAFAEAFRHLLGEDDARQALAARARERAGRFTVERMTAGTIAAYRAIAPDLAPALAASEHAVAEAAA